jgi:penicillin amidase
MRRWLLRSLILILVFVIAAIATFLLLMRGSLATLDGTVNLPGLSAPVSIERDRLGVITIHAANETDAMRALGYVHAQERFFEMDLLRRSAAGELSELFGPAALKIDKQHRVHRLRARALDDLQTVAGDKLPQIQAYTDGVNAGLADLKVRPWPYLVLQVKPEPWQLSDTALAGYAMFFDLQGGSNERKLALWRIRQVVPAALYKLIAADGTEWDAPLEGTPRGFISLPDAATLDLRKLPAPGIDGSPPYVDPNAPGSNNFAVAGPLTKDGRAIVANDMHLGLRAPDIWFRARLLYADARAAGGKVDVSGFTLPGVPGIIVGSNTHVAWGFTNSYGDWASWVQDCGEAKNLECDLNRKSEQIVEEKILVKGGPPFLLKVVQQPEGTRMPDITGANSGLLLTWTAHYPGALTLDTMDLALAQDVDAAVKVANHAGIPAQNMLMADSGGHIGWTIAGRIPAKLPAGCDQTAPARFSPGLSSPPPPSPPVFIRSTSVASPGANSRQPMDAPESSGPGPDRRMLSDSMQAGVQTTSPPPCGYVTLTFTRMEWLDQNPSILNPPSNRLWTANNRVTDGADLATIGDSGYALGARAKQIRDDLFAKNQFTEKDLLAIQLDDRTVFLERWWVQLRALLTSSNASSSHASSSNDAALKRIAAATVHWDTHASPDAVTYRIVRAWRLDVLDRIRDGLMAPAQVALGKNFVMPALDQLEGVAWELVTQRPQNLLPRKFGSWDALLIDAAHQADSELGKYGALDQRRWGERNTAAICHPLAMALPAFMKRLLCMPADSLPGDNNMPRVAAPAFGASERMVVSPGHEADGIIEMPAGQSGNPLSPFWGAGHEAWVHGEATPFLPGPALHTLRLSPSR